MADAYPLWLDVAGELVASAGLEVVGRAVPGSDALTVLSELSPDVFITELPPASEGLAAGAYVAQARALAPGTKIIVLSAVDDRTVVEEVLGSGAKGYVPKTAAAEDLAAAIRLSLDDRVFLANDLDVPLPGTGARVSAAESPGLGRLTPREIEILRLVAEGLTNAQLARRLSLSEQTVKFHLSNIYRKTGASNRTAASRWAHANGALGEHLDAARMHDLRGAGAP
ncbi:MAG TPA: response regulator transcription factor [Candidatus Limnocylindrales bacterium]|nr:response regulator transcription factor [Candidatus Limnocylindrales bacterium]